MDYEKEKFGDKAQEQAIKTTGADTSYTQGCRMSGIADWPRLVVGICSLLAAIGSLRVAAPRRRGEQPPSLLHVS